MIRLRIQTNVAWRDIIKHDPCVYCARSPREVHQAGARMTAEHITPRIVRRRDPMNDWRNLASACSFCNEQRGHGALLLYLLWRQTCTGTASRFGVEQLRGFPHCDGRARRHREERTVPPLLVPLSELVSYVPPKDQS